MSSKRVVFFIGGGNMATAIIAGINRQEWRVVVAEPYEPQRAKLTTTFPDITVVASAVDPSLQESNAVVFSIKPQSVPEVLGQLREFDFSQKTVISIMAGIPLSILAAGMRGNGIKFVRTMPNTPLMVNQGVTGIYTEDEDSKTLVKELLGATSKLFYVNAEDDLNKVCAISGSGPAYFFAFMEALRKAGEEMGLDRDMATEMAIGTCLGAATLAEQSKDDLSQLRQNVTSKGGTTEQALNSFNTSNLDDVVHKAVFAALHRGRELAAEVEKSSKL